MYICIVPLRMPVTCAHRHLFSFRQYNGCASWRIAGEQWRGDGDGGEGGVSGDGAGGVGCGGVGYGSEVGNSRYGCWW